MSRILNIHTMSDINKITSDTKYINISIDSFDIDIINYFLNNGSDYSYSDSISNKNGFIYVDYDAFKVGESILNAIVDNMPADLNDIEKVRYLYLTLGKNVGVDINTLSTKNEVISLNTITYLNNVWGALYKGKVTNESISKIFVYLCSKIGIKCEVVNTSISGDLANKVYVDNTFIIVNLFKDIANIKGGFTTEYFDKKNNNKDMDKKVLYIKDDYTEYYLDKFFKEINYNDSCLLYNILMMINKVLDVNSINTYEMTIIFDKIFEKYVPNLNIKINNFYLKKDIEREHFVIFNYNNDYYSYNYNKKCFIRLEYNYLIENIKTRKIGIYQNESFDIIKERVVL